MRATVTPLTLNKGSVTATAADLNPIEAQN
jgi:hypothetical protein